MKIEYRGINEDENRYFREAYITYDEQKEQKIVDKIFEILSEKGWKVEQEEECASIRVCNRTEYKELVEDYKKAKKVWQKK